MSKDDRSINAGRDITGGMHITGDNNAATLTSVQLPDAPSVDIAAVLSDLRAELARIAGDRAGQVSSTMDVVAAEAGRPEPDKAEVADGIERALGYVRKGGEFGESLGKIQKLVTDVAGWIGAASGYAVPLLAAVGLSIG